ncbi:hypothetical protein ACIGXF_25565 [Streptomyces sp. NPDC053086]|uniref:hypothetical protein n=1 Tax=unclassified Streptomyces TaxID=2593676 RepID=UPI0037D46BA0
MRPLYVPVRLAVTVLAVTTAAGCVNVGDDAGRARPAHSAGQHGGEAPDGGPVDGAGGLVEERAGSDGKHGHGGKSKPGESASASATPSGTGSASGAPAKPGKPGKPGDPGMTDQPGDPAPTKAQPTPPASSAPPEPPASTPPPPVSEPPSAEPSSSAHEETGPQLVQREPAPAAGVAV